MACFHRLSFLCFIALVASVGAAPALGQASYNEPFDNLNPTGAGAVGPSELSSRGWLFRNQSVPMGTTAFSLSNHGVNPILPSPHSGDRYLMMTDAACGQLGGALNAWAILPAAPGQRAGDRVSFSIFPHLTTSDVEIRYSPSGGTSTGSGEFGVGSFTESLGVVAAPVDAWSPVQLTLPGPGRIAIRYIGQRAAFNSFADFAAVDTLSVGVPPPPPCNAPPVPGAGQTVHWTAAGGPYRVCETITILAGATVIIDPGVRVDVDAQRQILIRGVLVASGAVGAPVVLTATANFPPMLQVEGGTLTTSFTQIGGQLRPLAGGSLSITDSSFTGPNGVVFADLYIGTAFGRFERVTFTNSELTITNHTLVLRDVTLNNSTCRLIRDYTFMRNVVVDGRPFDIDAAPQGTYIDTLTIRNVTSAPGGQTVSSGYGLGLNEGNFLVGPSVSLSNNTFPVRIVSAGVLPGSTLPATGNATNAIYVPGRDHHASVVWADAGLPYYIPDFYSQHGGALRVLPGARLKLSAAAGLAGDPSVVQLRGTPARPISVEPMVPGQRWFPIQNAYRIRHAILDGATRAAAWPSQLGWGFLDSSIVRNCSEFGVTGQAIVRKTLFANNAVGASISFGALDLDGSSNPNAFEGNGVGVSAAGNAVFNWWNSPSGPASPDNPGGTGDPKANGVPFLPFRTERPDFADAPPVVDVESHSFLGRPGQKMLLTWRATDNGTIVSQRVVMATDGDVVQGNLIEPVMVLADNLPGTQRSLEIVLPTPQSRFFGSGNIRVESTDDRGQIGWDDLHIYLERDEPGTLQLTSSIPAAVRAGQDVGQVCWSASGVASGGSVDAFLLLENSGTYMSLGGVSTYLNCLPLNLTAPFASTDRARIVLSLFTGGGVGQPEYFFGPAFSVRPDARTQDAAPSVAVTSPGAGASFVGGGVVPIRWTASDDEAVQTVHVQASTDGGRTWSFIAKGLTAASGAYDWRLPPSTGMPGVLVKVIAVDQRFQDSSAIVLINVTPGSGPGACVADFDGSGTLTVQDLFAYLSAWFSGDPRADVNGSGGLSVQDIFDYLTMWFAGC